MQLKTTLNRVQKFKPFVYGRVNWIESPEEPAIEVELHPRKNSWHIMAAGVYFILEKAFDPL